MAPATVKAVGALRTIGEVADEIGRPQHILRYWETRFPQLRPLKRAGGRRYYRAEDVALVRRIHFLLSQQGYTVSGVQRLLAAERGGRGTGARESALRAIRDSLHQALMADGGTGRDD